jgi:hypothetical protein
VPAKLLKQLFAKQPVELLGWIRDERHLKVEILCDKTSGKPEPFAAGCAERSPRKMFDVITSLHGQYLPEERTILIRSTATPGALIHEFLHSLQADNSNPIYGKVYKRDRLKVQRSIADAMSAELEIVKKLEAAGRKDELNIHVKTFESGAELLQHFGLWQDLIDERSLFQLYLKFGQEFGASDDDLALARKNMGFICENKALTPVLPKSECP